MFHKIEFSVYVCIAAIFLISVHKVSSQEPTVTIGQGILQGKVGLSRDGRPHYQFLAVPYGEIPERFEMGVPARNWTGTRLAVNSSVGCPQLVYPGTEAYTGIEDCLDLDIYTPILPSDPNFKEPLPVFYYIYGGGFLSGWAGVSSANYFMDEDVVVVIINHRLGALGFLNMEVKEARGNQGLKDQVLSLKWVQENIAKFGGDPKKVTIAGESSGGHSVGLLSLSNMSKDKNLYSQAIIQSGGAPCRTLFIANPGLSNAQRLASALDCPIRNATASVECLRKASVFEILAASAYLSDTVTDDNGLSFGPTYENYSDGENDPDVFFSGDPYEIMARGEFQRMPMIIGQCSNEAFDWTNAIFFDNATLEKFSKEFGKVMPHMARYENHVDDPCPVSGKIRDFYFNGGNITLGDFQTVEDLFNDRISAHCMYKMGAVYSNYNEVYMYNFTQRQSRNPDRPASHTDELPFLFDYSAWNPDAPILPDNPDYQFSKQMVALWVSFVRDGKPMRISGVEWTPLVKGQTQTWLQLNKQPEMKQTDATQKSRWDFWDSLPIREYGKNF